MTPAEVEKLIEAAKTIEPGERNSLMVMLAYGHGFRCEELLNLRWAVIDLAKGLMLAKRLKKGTRGQHELTKPELAALRKFHRTKQSSHDYVFHSPHGSRLTGSRFRQIVAEAGLRAKLTFPVHPHMLRHSCGYKLINDGVDLRMIQGFLGHTTPQHTAKYTALKEDAFKGIWKL